MTTKNLPMTFSSWVADIWNSPNTWSTWSGTEPYEVSYFPKNIELEFDKFFNQFWKTKNTPIISDGSSLPKTNVFEDKDGMHIQCFIPFCKKEDIKIILDPVCNSVKIEIDSHQDSSTEKKEYLIKEISRTSFKRTFMLDKKMNLNKAVAEYKDSVLQIDVPYEENANKKELTIK